MYFTVEDRTNNKSVVIEADNYNDCNLILDCLQGIDLDNSEIVRVSTDEPLGVEIIKSEKEIENDSTTTN